MSAEPELVASEPTPGERKTLRAIGWFSIGMAAATLGIYVGYELRNLYKFRRRTPYDFYSNAEAQPMSEFGVGI
jgi:translation initiation factor 2B subunit (eIF-2B alpha/beta/delta family)